MKKVKETAIENFKKNRSRIERDAGSPVKINEAGGAEIQSILWCVGSKAEWEDIHPCQKTSALYGNALLGPESKIAEYFVTVKVVSTAGLNSTRVSSSLRSSPELYLGGSCIIN